MSVLSDLFARWGRKDSADPCASLSSLAACTDVDELMREDLVAIFKHSTACPVSWAAHSQVTRFLRENPGAPVRMVRVIQERALSQKIAAAIGLRHESPQLIVLRRGEVISSASHGQITAENLNHMLSAAGASAPDGNVVAK